LHHLPGAVEQAPGRPRALPGVPVWAIDAHGIVVRPGLRLIDGVEALASVPPP
jgi:iron complex transport system substrate-binding protein